jgi:hypothetical protein
LLLDQQSRPNLRGEIGSRLPLDIVFLKGVPFLQQLFRGNECAFSSWEATGILAGRRECTFPSATIDKVSKPSLLAKEVKHSYLAFSDSDIRVEPG